VRLNAVVDWMNDDIQSTEAVSFMARYTDLHMTDGRELWNYR
jgi:hypothetical protein